MTNLSNLIVPIIIAKSPNKAFKRNAKILIFNLLTYDLNDLTFSCKNSVWSPSGGIGRRAGFKIPFS